MHHLHAHSGHLMSDGLQVHPPTGITHCTAAYFTQVNARGTSSLPDLIVARSTHLQVYTVR